ncbi:hypothetical protein BGZ94_002040, partial [Podila epigama]
EIGRLLGQQWRAYTDDQKAPYNKKHEAGKARYAAEKAAYDAKKTADSDEEEEDSD